MFGNIPGLKTAYYKAELFFNTNKQKTYSFW